MPGRGPLERLKEKLSGRKIWIALAGLACLVGGAALYKQWKPALGLGLIAHGLGGVLFDALVIEGWVRRAIGPSTDRVVGAFSICAGAVVLLFAAFE